ncbi:MAG TPA: hypothetical protein VF337_01635 [Candidatus Limnocylindrales bacterium]
MKTRIAAIAAALLLGSSLILVSAATVAAAGPSMAGPGGKGVCAAYAPGKSSPDPSGARGTATLTGLKAFGDCEINRRFATLTDLSSKITASKVITTSDKSTLQSEIGSTKAGLTSLKAGIDGDTDLTSLKADIQKIATEFRVYLLLAPQVHLVNGADAVLAAQTGFADINTRLAAAIAVAKTAGKDTTAAQTDLDAMNASVAAAAGLAGPLPAQLLPLTPAQYNGGTAGSTLANARTALVQARNDLKSAEASAKACRDALK